MKGRSKKLFAPSRACLALAVAIALVGCTNDYDAFDVAGESAGSSGPRDSGIDRSPTGAGGSGESDGEPEASGDEPTDAGAEALADASDAGLEAEPSDARFDAPTDAVADAPMDGMADAPIDAVVDAPGDVAVAPAEASSEAAVDAADVGADAFAEADGPGQMGADGGVDAGVEAGPPVSDAPVEGNVGADANDGGEAEVAMSCGAGTKPCNSGCANVTDPATGCTAASCAPCVLPHASATCGATGQCAVLVCGAGFEDCDTMAADGCEAELSLDVGNCGSCGHACAGVDVLSRQCVGGLCLSTCAIGHANCAFDASLADDGCERAVDDTHCGGCGNDCTSQGSGLKCGAAVASQCGCSSDGDCRVAGSGGTCDVSSGVCTCGTTICRGGEACRDAVSGSPPDVCSCGGTTACGSNQTCCQSPAGCRDLQNDPSSCGACGRSCPTGFFCAAGQCQCSGDLECNAGAPGTCATGQCVCGAVTCARGQRCMPGGICG